jgi:hypothetical protein
MWKHEQRKNTTAAAVVHSGLEGMKWLNPNYGSSVLFLGSNFYL